MTDCLQPGSREQNYRPEDCGTCHAPMTGSKGRGFWEGGKGTRDPARMSKKGEWFFSFLMFVMGLYADLAAI